MSGEKREPTERQKDAFRTILRPGEFWLLVGPRRSGKTSFACQIIDTAVMHGWYPEMVVATNILFKKKVRLEDGTETYEEYYPPGVFKVTSMSDVFHLLPGVIERHLHLILVVDEALQSEGFASGQSVLSGDVRAVRSFASIIGKMGVTVILIAQSWKMVASSYRNEDFITGIMRRMHDNQIISGYGRREVLEIIGPRGYQIKNDRLIVDQTFSIVVRTTAPTGLAKPAAIAELGDVVFDTAAPAQFNMGVYRKNGKKFQLFAAINAISSVIEEKTVAALRHHLENPPGKGATPDEDEGDGEHEEDITKSTGRRLAPEEKIEIMDRIAGGETKRKTMADMGIASGTYDYYAAKVREKE